jgi:hypothetical protein
LTPLVLSAAVAEGHPCGQHTTMLIERQKQRGAVYETAVDVVSRVATAIVFKGPVLAALYPEHLLRPYQDLDIVIPTEGQFWAAAGELVSVYGAAPSALNLVPHEGTEHCFLSLVWPSDDPLCESDFRVDMSTFAYAGDQAAIPMRVGPPESQALTQLFAVAEERFQGPFDVKHALDCSALLTSFPDALSAPGTDDVIRRFHLAPELHELLAYSTRLFGGGHRPAGLQALAEEERQRRRAAGFADAALQWDTYLTADGNLRFGIPLQQYSRPGTPRLWGRTTPGGELMHTPVGNFLMVSATEVSASDVATAERLSAQWTSQHLAPGDDTKEPV